MNGFALLGQSGEAGINFASLLMWGVATGGAGLALKLAPAPAWRKLGSVAAVVGLVLIGASLPPLGDLLPQLLFWLLALVAVIGSGSAITSRSPVYAAVWFAISLLGTAGLFLLQGAYFLGVATIVVYAGAIVVTFLFVLMLAQPEGHTPYDRMSWAGFVTPVAVIAIALLVGVIATSLPTFAAPADTGDVLAEDHVARLGTELFARHLVSVEVAGTLLLVALVGAIVIVIQGKPRRQRPAGETGAVERGQP